MLLYLGDFDRKQSPVPPHSTDGGKKVPILDKRKEDTRSSLLKKLSFSTKHSKVVNANVNV